MVDARLAKPLLLSTGPRPGRLNSSLVAVQQSWAQISLANHLQHTNSTQVTRLDIFLWPESPSKSHTMYLRGVVYDLVLLQLWSGLKSLKAEMSSYSALVDSYLQSVHRQDPVCHQATLTCPDGV